MSVIYLALDNNITALPGALLIVGDDDDLPFRVVYPSDPPQENCAVLVPGDMAFFERAPVGSYNVYYPYTRTALRVRMTDQDPLQQMGQFCDLLWNTSYIAVSVRLFDVNDQEVKVAGIKVNLAPVQLYACAGTGYAIAGELCGLVLIDARQMVFPARAYLTITAITGQVCVGWIGLRASRDAAPSGSVV